jgi:hypothetical protein
VAIAGEAILGARFTIQAGTPVGIPAFTHPEAGCNWMGVGGQVFNFNGEPLGGLVVETGGSIDGVPVHELGITGGATMLGPGGYEIPLSGSPVTTNGTVWIQLFDVDGTPLSNKILISTFADCERNLILVNFLEVTSTTVLPYYFPFVGTRRQIHYFPFVGQR